MSGSTPHLFAAWVAEQRKQATWWDGLSEDILRQLYDRYPGMNLDDLALLAIKKNPAAFEEVGIRLKGQRFQ